MAGSATFLLRSSTSMFNGFEIGHLLSKTLISNTLGKSSAFLMEIQSKMGQKSSTASQQLSTHSDNYGSWKMSMMIALNAKNKMKIINGDFEEPAVNADTRALWERKNDMIISWILNTITEQISNSLSFVNSASSLWKELQEHYSQLDGHRVYQLTHDLVQLKQNNTAIKIYYHKLKGLWDEVDGERDQWKRLIQFLMGLDECYANIRGQILLMNPVPTVAKAYNMIRQEEKNLLQKFQSQLLYLHIPITIGTSTIMVSTMVEEIRGITVEITVKVNLQQGIQSIMPSFSWEVQTTNHSSKYSEYGNGLKWECSEYVNGSKESTQSNDAYDAKQQGFVWTITRGLLMETSIMVSTSSNNNRQHPTQLLCQSPTTTWLSGFQGGTEYSLKDEKQSQTGQNRARNRKA
ncbi:cysteine-rich receptor-like protein kinase 8 [Tanacetum coccineum]|uniref:Cysteine-rich receptor-like protein kinase 8 n=1 Tax=Tanacetum coccineum TaxID=301880 RepID=A0ABQ5DTU7_9ASTR